MREMHLEDWFGFDWGCNHAEIPDSQDIRQAKEQIIWCDHVVFVLPTFWSAPPAQLKHGDIRLRLRACGSSMPIEWLYS